MLAESVGIIFLILIILKIISYLTQGRCTSPVCLIGKTVLITGGNSGIGFETGLQLAGRGCRLIIADKDNCDKSRERIIKETNNTNIVTKQFDLRSLESVRKLAQDINETEDRLDILINNAGIIGQKFDYTSDDLPLLMQTNHFGPFLLTHLLIDLLKKSAPSRIIFVSSAAAYFSRLRAETLNVKPKRFAVLPDTFMDYCNTKLCNVITTRGFAEKLSGTGVTCNSLYPGCVSTALVNNYLSCSFIGTTIARMYFKKPSSGAQTSIHLALAKEVENVTGTFFVDCYPFFTPLQAKNTEFSNQIWKLSEEYVKLSDEEKL